VLVSGVSWPSPLRGRQALLITYVCGWLTAAEVPSSIKTAIKMMVGWRFEHRQSDDLPVGALRILDKYRMIRI
jgi:hypothetical protein